MTPPTIITEARDLLQRYDVLLCDIWGVVHDGQRAFDAANDALTRFRAGGGTVVLVSNAPSPSDAVARVLDDRAVLRSAWDRIVSSGDLALSHIRAKGYQRLHQIGPLRRDRGFFDALPGPSVAIAEAEAIACTGLVDDRREKAEDYLPTLQAARQRRLPFVCANPDLHVHVGADLLECAGAIATLYAGLGGDVVWAGKPHPVAYAKALDVAAELRGGPVPRRRVLAIGDSVRTDLAAAAGAGVDALFIASGIHRDEAMNGADIDTMRLANLLSGDAPPVIGSASALRW
ncbi:MAG: TIGR01459 family HAD-type hydrolase [Hyphomicrobiaceae bacterium]